MVWEHKAPVIVMLTKLMEKNKVSSSSQHTHTHSMHTHKHTHTHTHLRLIMYAMSHNSCHVSTYEPPLLHLPHPLQRKCERYWETEMDKPFKPGRDLSVTTLRCDTHPEFELRTIKVAKVGAHGYCNSQELGGDCGYMRSTLINGA